MKTPKAITDAARRYLDYLDAELQEVQFSRDRAQEDLDRRIARVNECDSTIKQIHADQEEIRAWLAEQEGREQERSCATCKKQDRCPGPGSGRPQTGCSFWSKTEEGGEQE